MRTFESTLNVTLDSRYAVLIPMTTPLTLLWEIPLEKVKKNSRASKVVKYIFWKYVSNSEDLETIETKRVFILNMRKTVEISRAYNKERRRDKFDTQRKDRRQDGGKKTTHNLSGEFEWMDDGSEFGRDGEKKTFIESYK